MTQMRLTSAYDLVGNDLDSAVSHSLSMTFKAVTPMHHLMIMVNSAAYHSRR
jgi:hypothetical protein